MNEVEGVQPRTRRSVKIVLFLSLALNLLVLGLVIGAMAGHRFDHDRRSVYHDRAGGPLTAALSPADRRAIGKALREAARETRPSRARTRAEYQAVVAALTAEPYDGAAVRAAVERQLQGLGQRAELGKEMLLRQLDAMSAADRAAYAERLERVLARGAPGAPKGRRYMRSGQLRNGLWH
ncbi:periplasmic heavy metal sensor [Marimonas arenosa]|uniref:Periplasmic heavy metal sensor n=1 Tax=Marimonas arenosa TaxID=1795305 RepID=A0AAE3WI52_9RHOB|nr:periplasmic heavy metal sensor [Marimonas arenosa]MDQ2092252.1 periplasmic heavy metal sensor [Marimonas arenosa]